MRVCVRAFVVAFIVPLTKMPRESQRQQACHIIYDEKHQSLCIVVDPGCASTTATTATHGLRMFYCTAKLHARLIARTFIVPIIPRMPIGRAAYLGATCDVRARVCACAFSCVYLRTASR